MAPSIVQPIMFASSMGNAVTLIQLPLLSAVLSGNSVLVFANVSAAGSIPTVTDDKANTYTKKNDTSDGSQRGLSFLAENITNGPKVISLTFGVATNYVQFAVAEVTGVATSASVDGTPVGNSNGTGTAQPTSGSLTTTAANSIVFNYVFEDSIGTDNVGSGGWTKGTGMTMLTDDMVDDAMLQCQVKSSAGAINCAASFTPPAAANWVSISLALKAAAAGTLPPVNGIRVVACHHQGCGRAGTGSSYFVKFPCRTGNMLIAAFIGVASDNLSSITDSAGNTWYACGPSVGDGSTGNVRCFYTKPGATTLSESLKLTMNVGGPGAVPGDTVFLLEVVNGAAEPFDGMASLTGNNTAGSGITSWDGPTLTPQSANGLIISVMGITSHTVFSATPGQFLCEQQPNEVFSPWPADENNSWKIYYNTDLTPITDHYTSNAPVDTWAAAMFAFAAAPPCTVSDITPATGDQGTTGLALTLTGTRFTGV